MIAASASIEGCGGVLAVVAAVDGALRAVDGSDGDGDMTSEEASSVTSAPLASIVGARWRRGSKRRIPDRVRAEASNQAERARGRRGKTMENGALDIHDAAAWDDSALVAAYDAAIEKYEESHGGGSSARTTAAVLKHVAARGHLRQQRRTPRPARRRRRRTPRRRRRRRRGWRLGRATTSRSSRRRRRGRPRPRLDPRPAAARRRGVRARRRRRRPILAGRPGATAPPAVAAAAAAAAATAVSGAPSDQHEADLTNLILAWYHTGFFTAVYQERHGRR